MAADTGGDEDGGFIDAAQDELFSPRGVQVVLGLMTLFVIVAGLVFAGVEDYTRGDGLWWSIQTVTTVGYGDVVANTVIGRLIGIVLMIAGIGVFSLVTAAAAQVFLRRRLGMNDPATQQALRLRELTVEQRALRTEVEALRRALERAGDAPPPAR